MRPACFPESLGLVNPVAGQAYEMRFVEEKTIQAETLITEWNCKPDFIGPREWSPKTPCVNPILYWLTQTETCDATLVVRPYVKFLDKNAGLKGAKLSFTMDGDSVIDRAPLADYVVEDKYNSTLKPVRPQCRDLFFSCRLDGENQADASHTYGAMAVNTTRLEVYLHRTDPEGEPVRIECGLVAAVYTTKIKRHA